MIKEKKRKHPTKEGYIQYWRKGKPAPDGGEQWRWYTVREKMPAAQKKKIQKKLKDSAHTKRSVYKIDLHTKEVLEEYESIKEAAASTGSAFNSQTIRRVAMGYTGYNSCAGYGWKFVGNKTRVYGGKRFRGEVGKAQAKRHRRKQIEQWGRMAKKRKKKRKEERHKARKG